MREPQLPLHSFDLREDFGSAHSGWRILLLVMVKMMQRRRLSTAVGFAFFFRSKRQCRGSETGK
jgi:hypothetical protein